MGNPIIPLTEEEREELSDLYSSKLNLCTCGRPEEVQGFLSEVMKIQVREDLDWNSKRSLLKELITKTDPDLIFEFIFHVLESKDFAEHGSSVYGSWLTTDGEKLMELMERNYAEYLIAEE